MKQSKNIKQSRTKRRMAIICFVMLFMGMIMQPEAADSISLDEFINNDGSLINGDFNNDSALTADDLGILRQKLLDEVADETYDVTDSGAVDVRDVVRLKKMIDIDELTSAENTEDTAQWSEMY